MDDLARNPIPQPVQQAPVQAGQAPQMTVTINSSDIVPTDLVVGVVEPDTTIVMKFYDVDITISCRRAMDDEGIESYQVSNTEAGKIRKALEMCRLSYNMQRIEDEHPAGCLYRVALAWGLTEINFVSAISSDKIIQQAPFKISIILDPGVRTDYSDPCDVSMVMMLGEINHHLVTNSILSPRQYGFRRGLSTDHALLDVVGRIEGGLARSEFTLVVSFDVAKAFDNIPHKEIIRRMVYYHFDPSLVMLVADYLTNRQVKYGHHGGVVAGRITRGCPQGSVLGPILWDITYKPVRDQDYGSAAVIGFADDTVMIAQHRDIEQAVNFINNAIQKLTTTIASMGLRLNGDKTQAVLFTRRLKYAAPAITR